MNEVQFEVNLAKTANLFQLKEYLQRRFLCEEAQVELAKRNNTKLLLLYTAKFKMCDKAQIILVEKQNIRWAYCCLKKMGILTRLPCRKSRYVISSTHCRRQKI